MGKADAVSMIMVALLASSLGEFHGGGGLGIFGFGFGCCCGKKKDMGVCG